MNVTSKSIGICSPNPGWCFVCNLLNVQTCIIIDA